MRVVWVVALLLVSACASEKLALAPPPGVDFSGQWKLNEADSDDPQRVALSQNAGPAIPTTGSNGGQGGQGGRGGGRGGRGAAAAGGYGGTAGPAMPGVGALNDGLRWPGRELDIKQVAGAVTITSLGTRQVYQPVSDNKSKSHQKPPDDDGAAHGRDGRARHRGDGPPAVCGWDDKALVVQSENPDDDHPPFEERYSLSDDGQRLIEVVAFKGGRSRGFTVSRVWDRVSPGGAPDAPGARPPAQ
jgi:hypothetical protein